MTLVAVVDMDVESREVEVGVPVKLVDEVDPRFGTP